MNVFEAIAEFEHEQVLFCHDKASGLRSIIAIHNTTLGPALGGTRLWPYESEEHALTDVLRLSRAMTYKAAVAGLNLGGGKSVIIADSTQKTEALLRAHARFVHSLGGRYITAEDVNISTDDVDVFRRETPYVTGASKREGGSGDPSPVTAFGVFHGIRACLVERWGDDRLGGRAVAIQGAGSVGFHLAKYLTEAGAEVFITDIVEEKVSRAVSDTGAKSCRVDEVLSLEVDVLAPCALGGVINDQTIPTIKAPVIAGGANNQLGEACHGEALRERGILYAPDFVINAGGLISVDCELRGCSEERACQMAEGIYDTVTQVLRLAKEHDEATNTAAYRLAETRLSAAGRDKRIWLPRPEEEEKKTRVL